MENIKSVTGGLFYYNRYFKTWSRVVWHRCRATEQQAKELGIPDCVHTVEVDLTGVTKEDWERVRGINIRFHSTPLNGADLHGELPASTVQTMKDLIQNPYTISLLMFDDLLQVIEFANSSRMVGGGIPLRQLYKGTLTR